MPGILMASASTQAVPVQIQMNGTVDFNVIQGNQAGIPSGSPVVMSFQVESTNFTDSMNFPVRGYEVIQSSFSLALDGISVGMPIRGS